MAKFIEKHIIKSKFDSLTPEERQAHKEAMVKALMDCVVGKTIMFVNMSDTPKVEPIKVEPVEIVPVVKKKTRPINPLRHRADGSYSSHSLVPNYNASYYEQKTKGVKVVCPCCETEVLKSNYAKHTKSLKCTHVAMCQALNAKPS